MSYPNYASRAKAEHIADIGRHGVAWSVELSVAIKDATRSVQRGLGSARQSMPLDVIRVHQLNLGLKPITVDGPIAPALFATLGIFFLAREIELACVASSDLKVDTVREEVSWVLPVSKNDQRALGITRTWGCVCHGDLRNVCPYHAAVAFTLP